MLNYYDKGSGLGVTEQLYTARGSQGFGTYEQINDLYGVNPEENYNELLMILYRPPQTSTNYKLRPLFTTKRSPDILNEKAYSPYGLI